MQWIKVVWIYNLHSNDMLNHSSLHHIVLWVRDITNITAVHNENLDTVTLIIEKQRKTVV